MRHVTVALAVLASSILELGCILTNDPCASCSQGMVCVNDQCVNAASWDISFLWSFPGGATCAQTSGAPNIHVALTGNSTGAQQLPGDGWTTCTTSGSDGIKFTNFVSDTYSYTLDGYDSSKTIKRYTASGTVKVNGNVTETVVLDALTSTLNVYWHFGSGAAEKTCATAGVADSVACSKVQVAIDNTAAQELDCTQTDTGGNPVQAYSYEVDPGTHQVSVTASFVRKNGATDEKQVWYSGSASGTVTSGATRTVDVVLVPTASGARIKPVLEDAAGNPYLDIYGHPTCNAANVDGLHIKLVDWNGALFTDYTTATGAECDTALKDGVFWDFLPCDQSWDDASSAYQATYKVTVEALDNGALVVGGSRTVDGVFSAGIKDETLQTELKF